MNTTDWNEKNIMCVCMYVCMFERTIYEGMSSSSISYMNVTTNLMKLKKNIHMKTPQNACRYVENSPL